MSDQSLDFGDVAVGTSSPAQSVQAQALTAVSIDITVDIQDDPDGVFSIKPQAAPYIPGNGKILISVVFTPKAMKSYVATLVVTPKETGPNSTVHQIPLSGTGDSPQIAVMPSHLAFTAVACPPAASSPRCSDTESVTITNPGIVNLTLGQVSIIPTDASTPVPANLNLAMLVSTMVILPGQMAQVPILWQPHGDTNVSMSEVGDFTASLQIQSNDPVHPTVTVPLTAHADPAAAPQACINVLSVTERQYTTTASGNTTIAYPSVPSSVWLDPNPANTTIIHVRPGMQITLTSLPVDTPGSGMVDTAKEQSNPCTFDPQGLTLTPTWVLSSQPSDSRTSLLPATDDGIQGADASIQIDAAGTYDVTFEVADSLGLNTNTSFTLDAQPEDDVYAELDWTMAEGIQVDLDIHFLVDRGPNVSGQGALFCTQDCFFYNTMPNWFLGPAGADEIPRFLRDDQGNSAGLPSTESVDLIRAPQPPDAAAGSHFRVAVYYYALTVGNSGSVTPSVTITHLGTSLGTFTASQQLSSPGDVWYAASVDFPPSTTTCATCATPPCDCPPTATALNQFGNITFPPGIVDGQINHTCQ
jgi:hypothetical protein